MEEILHCEMIRRSYSNRNARCPFGIARKRERDGILGSRMVISFEFHHILPDSRLRAPSPSSFSIQSTIHEMCDHSASKWVFPTNIIFIWMFYNLLFSLWFTMLVRLIADAFFRNSLPNARNNRTSPQQLVSITAHRSENERKIRRNQNQPHHRRPDPICVKMDDCLQRNTSPNKCVLLSIETHFPSTYKSRIICHSEFDKQRRAKKPR